MLHEHAAEGLPRLHHIHISQYLCQPFVVYFFLSCTQEHHPVTELSEADSACEEMVEEMAEDEECIEGILRRGYCDAAE